MELLDIVNEQGMPTGVTEDREVMHANGIPHRTSHVWIMRKTNTTEVLLQKRSLKKDSYPGCYDISSAGHIPAGVDFVASALRELEEELGLKLAPEELTKAGDYFIAKDSVFYGKPFHDREYSRVFYTTKPINTEDLILQVSEVSAVKWMPLAALKTEVLNKNPMYCVDIEELNFLPEL